MQIFSKEMIVAEYLINKKFISSVLCIKKDVAGNDCQGKCHLKKELAKDESQESTPASKSKSFSEALWDVTNPQEFTFIQPFRVNDYHEFPLQLLQGTRSDIFHPPGC